jgi:cytidylate kinase
MRAKGQHVVIAIDGPAASGKSSVARALARRFGFVYVNSGAMYRAVTWYILRAGVDPHDRALIGDCVGQGRLVCDLQNNESRILIDELDPSAHLHDDAVNRSVSLVSRVARVREILGKRMHDYAREYDLVMEGRDIGSVVFPDTPFKFYLDASPQVRSRRRAAQGQRDEIDARDLADSSRHAAPLVIAKDAEVIDTSDLTIEAVVGKIVTRLKSKNFPI